MFSSITEECQFFGIVNEGINVFTAFCSLRSQNKHVDVSMINGIPERILFLSSCFFHLVGIIGRVCLLIHGVLCRDIMYIDALGHVNANSDLLVAGSNRMKIVYARLNFVHFLVHQLAAL